MTTYISKCFIRSYYYSDYTNLYQVVVAVIRIHFRFHVRHTQLSITWYPKIIYACHKSVYMRVISFKYSQILGYHKDWISMDIVDGGRNDLGYKRINIAILDIIAINTELVISKWKFGATDSKYTSCNG